MILKEVEQIISDVVMPVENDKEKKAKETIQIVVFDLVKEEFAVKIDSINEIIEVPKITPIPSAPEFIKGILNLRGKIVVVVDLEKRFLITDREEVDNSKHIIIIEMEGSFYGLIVDRVKEVLRVTADTIQSTPSMIASKIKEEFFDGVIVLEEQNSESRLIVLLNVSRLLEERELMELGQVIKSKNEHDI